MLIIDWLFNNNHLENIYNLLLSKRGANTQRYRLMNKWWSNQYISLVGSFGVWTTTVMMPLIPRKAISFFRDCTMSFWASISRVIQWTGRSGYSSVLAACFSLISSERALGCCAAVAVVVVVRLGLGSRVMDGVLVSLPGEMWIELNMLLRLLLVARWPPPLLLLLLLLSLLLSSDKIPPPLQR